MSDSSFILHSSSFRLAFTLTEILIVIGIIVLLIALAVPAFSIITGGKSIEGATNQISAMLGRARAQAIGLQKPTGILFFIEPRSARVNVAIVVATDGPPSIGTTNQIGDPLPSVWLDLADDADFVALPPGVSTQTICDGPISNATPPVRAGDGYLGFGTRGMTPTGNGNDANVGATPIPGARFGGVILFDGAGRIICTRYGFKCVNAANQQSRIGGLLKPTGNLVDMIPGNKNNIIRSQLGFVMFERDPFNTQGYTEDDAATQGTTYGTVAQPGTEAAEEDWLDKNATPVLINRYAGTLVKGE
jgi:type II secretory pathway pseudopilin PulG